ncbi:MAG: ABC transporter ATP-binding protein, partial [Clostridiales bacterium]|nr:ABC transporter ATP-binding protein [Clostridiales bacterium]
FLDIIRAEHEKGKTIFMSSHMFDELETTCDRVALIHDGRISDVAVMNEIKNRPEKEYKIEFNDGAGYDGFKSANYKIVRDQPQYNQLTVAVGGDKLNALFRDLKRFDVKFITEVKYNLEKHFKSVLNKEKESSENVQ